MENIVLKNADNWHKSQSQIDIVKELLKGEIQTVPYITTVNGKIINTTTQKSDCIPILHNEGEIFLQFCGWSINLNEDGTWFWEDTTGG